MIALFWTAVAAIAWTYMGFPAWVLARGRWKPRPLRPDPTWIPPDVTIIIAAHNEAASIADKVRDVLALDHGENTVQLVVASDGSTDDTVAEATQAGGSHAVVLDLPRSGKAPTLNAAIAASNGEILVFTDANSRLKPDALTHLLAPFADSSVGGVAGDQRYSEGSSTQGQTHGERRYWDFDRALKRAESRAGNVISATGALYAVRRQFVGPVADGVTDDFYISTGVVAGGARLVLAEGAVAWEPPAATAGLEYERKVRVMTRGFRGVILRRALLDPRRTGAYAVQLLSHKILRRLVVLPLAVLAIASAACWRQGPLYRLVGLGQLAVYTLGAIGLGARDRPIARAKILQFPAYFCLVNAAALRAAINVATGRRITQWDTRRPGDPSLEPALTPDEGGDLG